MNLMIAFVIIIPNIGAGLFKNSSCFTYYCFNFTEIYKNFNILCKVLQWLDVPPPIFFDYGLG